MNAFSTKSPRRPHSKSLERGHVYHIVITTDTRERPYHGPGIFTGRTEVATFNGSDLCERPAVKGDQATLYEFEVSSGDHTYWAPPWCIFDRVYASNGSDALVPPGGSRTDELLALDVLFQNCTARFAATGDFTGACSHEQMQYALNLVRRHILSQFPLDSNGRPPPDPSPYGAADVVIELTEVPRPPAPGSNSGTKR